MIERAEDLTISTDGYPEIVIGLVAPVGVDLVSVEKKLGCSLREFGYDEVVTLKVSDIIRETESDASTKSKKLKIIDEKSFKNNLLKRYKTYIEKGNTIRIIEGSILFYNIQIRSHLF